MSRDQICRQPVPDTGVTPVHVTTALAAMLMLVILLMGFCAAVPLETSTQKLPFAIGEKISYDVTAHGGKIGDGAMWIEGPVDVRGTSTYLLRFDSKARIALMTGVTRTASWFDPARASSLRFSKHERSPLVNDDQQVEMFPATHTWESLDGNAGNSAGDLPLDELSFIYFLRTLPMTPGPVRSFDRFFDATRNPVLVQIVRREIILTPMGELKTLLIEMRVKDAKHYKGYGLIRINLTDDACRLPARIESRVPIVGTAVMLMKSENASADCAKR